MSACVWYVCRARLVAAVEGNTEAAAERVDSSYMNAARREKDLVLGVWCTGRKRNRSRTKKEMKNWRPRDDGGWWVRRGGGRRVFGLGPSPPRTRSFLGCLFASCLCVQAFPFLVQTPPTTCSPHPRRICGFAASAQAHVCPTHAATHALLK